MRFGSAVVVTALAAVVVVGLSYQEWLHPAVPFLEVVQGRVAEGWELLRPGGEWHPERFLEHHGHLAAEAILLAVISYLLFQSSSGPKDTQEKPLTQEVWGLLGKRVCVGGRVPDAGLCEVGGGAAVERCGV